MISVSLSISASSYSSFYDYDSASVLMFVSSLFFQLCANFKLFPDFVELKLWGRIFPTTEKKICSSQRSQVLLLTEHEKRKGGEEMTMSSRCWKPRASKDTLCPQAERTSAALEGLRRQRNSSPSHNPREIANFRADIFFINFQFPYFFLVI